MDFLSNILIGTFVALIPLCWCIVLEHIGPIERYYARDRIAGFLMNGVGTSLSIALMIPLAALWSAVGIAPAVTIPLWRWLEPWGVGGAAMQFLVLILIADFLAYWRHRAEHSFFWSIHAVHHSPRELHAANSIGHPL